MTNEIRRAIVVVRGTYPGEYPGSSTELPIVWDQTGHHTNVTALTSHPNLQLPASSAIQLVCRLRAPLTVRGRLLQDGQQVSPEKYLATWRTAPRVCHSRVAEDLQIALSSVATFDLRVERCNKGGYLLEELGIVDIDSLVSQFPAVPVGQQWRIEFDLASPHAWRVFAQFAARSYYDPEVRAQPAQFHVQTRALAGTAPQPDLFGEELA
ncbi:hypothetical protein [Cupriavidus basilensis]|jgi:hypothetical protein|uniref:hypothetical protein n=1 Tax=Cupriavidus basilensis TaxID=68895 RepID=UPI0020A675CB|nr:hypothetical protein [Cupriavidus basilensis]MCP3024587.1 hypothetical protein [Cupriavidus basilensis]